MARQKSPKKRTSPLPNLPQLIDATWVQEHARALVPVAFEELGRLLNDPDVSNRDKLAAINTVLDRAVGKPGQSVDLTSSDGSMSPQVAITWEVIDGGKQ